MFASCRLCQRQLDSRRWREARICVLIQRKIVMPVIAPLEMDEIDTESRARIDAGLATGMYSQTLPLQVMARAPAALRAMDDGYKRSEEHTSELQSLMRTSYAVFCLKKKNL